MRGLLEKWGLEVFEAEDGLIARQIIEARRPLDLLITDFRMPEMNGVELLEWCREKQFHFPVVFLSSEAKRLQGEDIALEDCCATLLMKPLKVPDLLASLAAADAQVHHEKCVHARAPDEM